MSLAACVSIPSSLDADRLTMTAPDSEEVRLREARRTRARCPECGKLGLLEVLTVHRPGLPSVVRTVIRCTRTARKDPRGRELASTRCPLTIVNEEPLPDRTGEEAGEFREFREDHEKGALPLEARRTPQNSAPEPAQGPDLTAVSPDQENPPEGPPEGPCDEPEEDDMTTNDDRVHEATREERACARCAAPIEGPACRKYCPTCSRAARLEAGRARWKRTQDRRREDAPTPGRLVATNKPGQKPTSAPPPPGGAPPATGPCPRGPRRRPAAGQDRGRLMTAPTCPLCGCDLVPSPRLAGYLECPDRTCSGLLRDDEGRPAWEELLGAPTQDLMRAPATPQGGSHGTRGGGTRQRRKALKAVQAYRRERRYLDQDAPPAGPGDRAPAEARKPVLARVPLPLAAWLEQAAARAGLSQSAIIEGALQAVADGAWCLDCNLPGLPEAACVGRCSR